MIRALFVLVVTVGSGVCSFFLGLDPSSWLVGAISAAIAIRIIV